MSQTRLGRDMTDSDLGEERRIFMGKLWIYILVLPLSVVVALVIAGMIVAVGFNLHEDPSSGTVFILISCVLIVILPYISFRLIRKYYKKTS
jgi:uncharacterized membrane protein